MICILCLSTSDQIMHIFDENGLRLSVNKIITKHFWLQPNAEDANSKVICCSCWIALDSFHKFYQKVEEAHVKLTSVKSPLEDDVSDADNLDASSDVDMIMADIKLEADDDSKLDLPQIEVQKPVDQLEIAQRNSETEETIKSDSESDVPLIKLSKRVKLSEEVSTAEKQSNDVPNIRQREKKLTDDESDSKATKPKVKRKTDSNNEKMTKSHVSCHEFDEVIKQNIKLSCHICNKSLATFFILKEHYLSVHDEVGFVTCCDRKFDSRHALAHHIMLHQNPECFKCNKCGRVLASNKSLMNHMKTHVNEERIHQCSKCKKSFSRSERLDRHMKTHVKLEQICEQCGKVCQGKTALRQHQLREHSNVPRQRVQCPKCGVDFADNSSLHTHTKYLHPKTEVLNVCNICGKISSTAYGLKRHIKYMHKCERRHKCPMCEKAFKAAQILREHMTTHTGEVLYTCPYCPKTFNSNANMHSHRKKMHRKQWEANRRHPHMGSTAKTNTE